jgi:Pvc16 N-terminal domain
MKTALRACSISMRELLRQSLIADPDLDVLFDPGQGGPMVVSLDTPEQMSNLNREGVSLWLYRVQRDEQTLNRPPQRIAADRIAHRPLPLRLHYLVSPIIDRDTRPQAPELEQHVIGKVMQVFHDTSALRGPGLIDDFAGQDMEVFIRLEAMTLEETTRVWDALDLSYQLSISYEVSVIPIASALAVDEVPAVQTYQPEYGLTEVGL